MNGELVELLNFDAPENRTAFIAALIMERCRTDPGDRGLGKSRNVGRFNAYQAERIAVRLVELAGRIHRYAEICCNREPSAIEQRNAAKAQTTFERIAGLIGLIPTTGGDPRGACAYLLDPHHLREDDDMGGRGWGVYK